MISHVAYISHINTNVYPKMSDDNMCLCLDHRYRTADCVCSHFVFPLRGQISIPFLAAVNFDGPSWIKYDLFCTNKILGSEGRQSPYSLLILQKEKFNTFWVTLQCLEIHDKEGWALSPCQKQCVYVKHTSIMIRMAQLMHTLLFSHFYTGYRKMQIFIPPKCSPGWNIKMVAIHVNILGENIYDLAS